MPKTKDVKRQEAAARQLKHDMKSLPDGYTRLVLGTLTQDGDLRRDRFSKHWSPIGTVGRPVQGGELVCRYTGK